MTRKRSASTVDRSLAVKYFDKATRFKADAEKMSVLADEFSGNGVAVCTRRSHMAMLFRYSRELGSPRVGTIETQHPS
jgi:hypothetical protein